MKSDTNDSCFKKLYPHPNYFHSFNLLSSLKPSLCIVPINQKRMGFEPEGSQNILNLAVQLLSHRHIGHFWGQRKPFPRCYYITVSLKKLH